MIAIPGGVRILVAMRPVDFRSGADRLAALAQETLQQNPFAGTVLVFRAKRTDRVKILLWDGSGLVLIWKRLEKSTFQWPSIADGMMQLSPGQFSALFEGLDWKKVHAVDVRAPVATA
jgi:transposase